MRGAACGLLASALWRARPSAASGRGLRASRPGSSADGGKGPGEPSRASGPGLLDFLVCPLSKKPLRYEASTSELINEELGIAYPIIDGIPNMIPQAARTTHQNKKQEEAEPTLDHN